ncbi:MAG: formylglycine-generating enzyme family protein [Thermoanaerobaculia bacterium]|nr:formylglycine-generating enzyme family protein [Thermoanaerobaculia bacterium]
MRKALRIGLVVASLPLAGAEAQNRIVNPEFDVDTSGWTQALSWSPFDRDGCSRSGSGEAAGSSLSQSPCVPVQAGEPFFVEYSSKSFPNPGDWSEASAVACYAVPDCSGAPTPLVPLAEALGGRKSWNRHRLEYAIPAGMASCSVGPAVTSNSTSIWLDGVYAGPPGYFADGFEQGSGCRWSTGPAEEMTILLPGDVPLTLVLIPAGTFQMGSPESERGRNSNETLHDVMLTQPYWMGKTEVTQAQWEALMGPWSYTCTSGVPWGIGPDYPAYCVSWDDVAGPGGFLDLLNTHLGTNLFRLPTEAEWERAARGGTQTRFSHGDVLECNDDCVACGAHDLYMWWCGNYSANSHPVGSKGANPFGLYDMHGNLLEWVQDWYEDDYPAGPAVDPTGPASSPYRVLRGGYWYRYARFCRSAYRYDGTPTSRDNYIGFRLARSR